MKSKEVKQIFNDYKVADISLSDFGKKELDPDQLKYSSNDVLHIIKIHGELNNILIREKRLDIYKNALKYLKVRVDIDMAGYENMDVWSHE